MPRGRTYTSQLFNLSVLGSSMYTVVKFFANYNKASANPLISHSLLKVAFIKKDLEHEVQHDEFWTVEILEEKARGQFRGCFLLRPIRKVEKEDILRLPPNTFTVRKQDGLLVLTPMKTRDGFWIVPLAQRKALASEYQAYGVVVDLDLGQAEDPEKD